MAIKSNRFVVCLHDVAPFSEREVMEQLALLRPLLGSNISTAVIPAAPGESWETVSPDFMAALQPLERLLHGFFHMRSSSLSPISLASGRCDEFAGLKPPDVIRRLSAGQEIMTALFGRPATGFLPPAWRAGTINPEILASQRLMFQVGYFAAKTTWGKRVPLATYSWDWGPAAFLGRLGPVLGRLFAFYPGSVKVIVLHPRDRERGYLRLAIDLVRRSLDSGFVPMRFSNFLEETRCGHG